MSHRLQVGGTKIKCDVTHSSHQSHMFSPPSVGTLISDLCRILNLLAAFVSAPDFAPRRHALRRVATDARLLRAPRSLQGALVLDDEGTAGVTSGEPAGHLRELQTGLQRPDGVVVAEHGQRVHAVAQAPVQRRRAGPPLSVRARARVSTPAVRPVPGRVLLRVPSVPRERERSEEARAVTPPSGCLIPGAPAHMFLLLCMCCIRCMLCSAVMSKAAVSASPPPSSS